MVARITCGGNYQGLNRGPPALKTQVTTAEVRARLCGCLPASVEPAQRGFHCTLVNRRVQRTELRASRAGLQQPRGNSTGVKGAAPGQN